MSTLSAILIIDMQNDFLVQGGAFTKRHIEPHQLMDAVAWLVQAARQQRRQVAWVASHYGEATGDPDALQGKTHTGDTPCCVKGSWGAQIVERLQPLFSAQTPDETHIIKHWYSAFTQTNLHEWLQQHNIKKLSLCGVTTNICVTHTAQEALRLGYQVEILHEATSASTQGKHMSAVRELCKLGATERHWGELLSESAPVKIADIAGDSFLQCASLSSCIDDKTFETLKQEVPWNQMSHRGGVVPRLIAIQGDKQPDGVEPLYRHPADEQPALTYWTPTVDQIRRDVEKRVGHPLNHCLLQLYRNGRDWISDHADKTLDVARPSFIVNVSLGVTRTMVFRSKHPTNERSSIPQKLPMPHGSLFMLSLKSNQQFYHGIKQLGTDGTDEPRISLTLRHIGTFYDPKTGAVWGIGSPSKTRAEAEARAKLIQSMSPEERFAKERDEADRMLKLFRDENVEDTFDAASYQPGFEILNFQSLLK
jgi:nicotinamidase-related amidase/alkylated DNA repair dioxygenase AlkB